EVEIDHDVTRNDVGRAGSTVDVRHLPRRRHVVFVAVIPFLAGEFGQSRYRQMDRILRQMRIGDVALDSLDGQATGHRAAPTVLDHVAERVDRGRFADDAVVELLPARLQAVADDDGAV